MNELSLAVNCPRLKFRAAWSLPLCSMYFQLLLCYHHIVFSQHPRLTIRLAQANQTVKALLKRVVVANDKQLIETTHAPDLLCQVRTAQPIHVLSRLIKKCDIERRELFEQREAHRERSAHLFSTTQLGESTIDALAMQDNFIVVLPGELRAAVTHDLTKNALRFNGDVAHHSFQYMGSGLLD